MSRMRPGRASLAPGALRSGGLDSELSSSIKNRAPLSVSRNMTGDSTHAHQAPPSSAKRVRRRASIGRMGSSASSASVGTTTSLTAAARIASTGSSAVSEYRDSRSALIAKNEEYKQALSDATEQYEALLSSHEGQAEEIERLRASLSASASHPADGSGADLQRLRTNAESLEVSNALLRAERDELSRNVADKENELAEIKARLSDVEDTTTTEIASLRSKLEGLKVCADGAAEVEVLRSRLQESQEDMLQLHKRGMKEADDLRLRVEESEAARKVLESRLERMCSLEKRFQQVGEQQGALARILGDASEIILTRGQQTPAQQSASPPADTDDVHEELNLEREAVNSLRDALAGMREELENLREFRNDENRVAIDTHMSAIAAEAAAEAAKSAQSIAELRSEIDRLTVMLQKKDEELADDRRQMEATLQLSEMALNEAQAKANAVVAERRGAGKDAAVSACFSTEEVARNAELATLVKDLERKLAAAQVAKDQLVVQVQASASLAERKGAGTDAAVSACLLSTEDVGRNAELTAAVKDLEQKLAAEQVEKEDLVQQLVLKSSSSAMGQTADRMDAGTNPTALTGVSIEDLVSNAELAASVDELRKKLAAEQSANEGLMQHLEAQGSSPIAMSHMELRLEVAKLKAIATAEAASANRARASDLQLRKYLLHNHSRSIPVKQTDLSR
jgi:hypothetical protein